jgi:hypothetical protein
LSSGADRELNRLDIQPARRILKFLPEKSELWSRSKRTYRALRDRGTGFGSGRAMIQENESRV